MGDTGSLALGGALGTLCVLIKKELLLPTLGGVFLMETLSVIIQRLYFKYTKRRFGQGRGCSKRLLSIIISRWKDGPNRKLSCGFISSRSFS